MELGSALEVKWIIGCWCWCNIKNHGTSQKSAVPEILSTFKISHNMFNLRHLCQPPPLWVWNRHIHCQKKRNQYTKGGAVMCLWVLWELCPLVLKKIREETSYIILDSQSAVSLVLQSPCVDHIIALCSVNNMWQIRWWCTWTIFQENTSGKARSTGSSLVKKDKMTSLKNKVFETLEHR